VVAFVALHAQTCHAATAAAAALGTASHNPQGQQQDSQAAAGVAALLALHAPTCCVATAAVAAADTLLNSPCSRRGHPHP
jgi:hypothetical protein